MSIHTILSQIEGQVFGHGEEVIEISIYRKDGKILSIPYNQVKTGLETFATRIVEEVGEELIGSDDDIKILIAPMFKTMAKIRNQLRQEQRTKLQKMKEI